MTTAKTPPTSPTKMDAEIARDLLKRLGTTKKVKHLRVMIEDTRFQIPEAMIRVLIDAAKLIAEGHPIGVIRTDEEVSAQEAADMLKMSRPHLLNLVRKGVLRCRMVGTHHRIPMAAIIEYQQNEGARIRSLEALTAETQKLGY